MNFGGSVVKNLPAVQEMWVWSLGWEDPLEKEMATLPSILAWEIPWTEEPGGSYSPWGCKRVGYNSTTKQQQQTMNFNFLYSICSDHKNSDFCCDEIKFLFPGRMKKKLNTKLSLCIRLGLFPPSLMCRVCLHYILNKPPWRQECLLDHKDNISPFLLTLAI